MFIGILFDGKPGQWRVDARQYAIMRSQTRKRITSPQSINAGDQVVMSMFLRELGFDRTYCPFPSCGAALPVTNTDEDKQCFW
jgi:hypothetical protein